ncbi:MAG: FAD-dependent monooxygenase [Parvibaculaceae bacterium]
MPGRVLIVGAGPVGLVAALSLAKAGVPSLLIDRHETPVSAPKAHAVNPRTLEICDALGVSAASLRETGASANDAGHVRFMGRLSGPEFGALPYERQDDAALAHTPFPLTNIPQPKFEAALTKAVLRQPLITFRRGVTCASLAQTPEQVVAVLEVGPDKTREHVAASYVIAADGAGSRLRGALGIAMEGPDALQHNVMIHFEADLSALTADHPALLYFLFEPATKGVLIAYDRAKTWVLMHPFDPAHEKPEDFTDDVCRRLITEAIGAPVPDLTICNVSSWTMSAQVAQTYRSARVFLAGDAAHRFPPTGGLGLNTGVVDAQNLSWKIAAVLKREAGPSLLDTYETERRPVALLNTEQSLTNAAKLFDLFGALYGPDPLKLTEHYTSIAANPHADTALALAVELQRPHFDSFNLQLGYRYCSPAIIAAPPPAKTSDVDISDYKPVFDAGAHLPHRWVIHEDKRISLLDLVPVDGFTLIAGPKGTVHIADANALGLTVLKSGTDFTDETASWTALTGLPDEGALLLRPDRHIAARLKTTTSCLHDRMAYLLAKETTREMAES